MTVHISPELEAVIAEDLKIGKFQSREEYVENAIQLLHQEQQLELLENRDEIAALIEEGLDAADRGELLDEAQSRADLEAYCEQWIRSHRPAER